MDQIQLKKPDDGRGAHDLQKKEGDGKIGGGGALVPDDAAMGTGPVQRKDSDDAPEAADDLHHAAAEGVASGGGPLPHGDKIQASFGKHDVSGVRAHTGAAAASATAAIGAEAYATGNDVAFGSASPSLHTAAHEAAHVVQQRGGVQLKGGVGQAGDSYEQHADAVADRVVQGKSAESLLDQHAPSGGGAGGGGGVQRKALQFEIKGDLRKTMKGWGKDDKAIFARLQSASPAELQAVVADPVLVGQLRKELSRSSMERVLDMLSASAAYKLHLAMSGWGRDEAYIFRTLNAATPAELAAIAANGALVNQLKGEISRPNMNRVLERLNFPLGRRLQFAMEGWGCDELYITHSVSVAPISDVLAMAGNQVLFGLIQKEMSSKAFDTLRAILAHRMQFEGGNHAWAWAMLQDPNRATRAARLAAFAPLANQRMLLDTIIASGGDGNSVLQAFESYWDIDVKAATGQALSVQMLQQMHTECKHLPEHDVRSGALKKLTAVAGAGGSWDARKGDLQIGAQAVSAAPAAYGVGTALTQPTTPGDRAIIVKDPAVFAAGATISIGHGTGAAELQQISNISGNTIRVHGALSHRHEMQEHVTPDNHTAKTDVHWLPAVLRHEIAHSVETALGGLVRAGFAHGLGGFDSHISFDTWAMAMGAPWSTNDGSVITPKEQKQIKAAIESAKAGAGGKPLFQTVSPKHPIHKYWNKNVPVLEAAKPCIEQGMQFYNNAELVYKVGGRRFSINTYYHEYQYYNEQVHASRVRDYAIFSPAEFFAEVYTVFYEQAGAVPDAQLGARVPVASWRDWIRNNVHNRGMVPAASNPGAPHPSGEAGHAPVASLPSPGVGKSAGNSGHA